VQETPKALTSLKYFNENASQYDIVCAGSLLGIALHPGTSFPVEQHSGSTFAGKQEIHVQKDQARNAGRRIRASPAVAYGLRPCSSGTPRLRICRSTPSASAKYSKPVQDLTF
jgi:hypothetical protein